MSKPHQYKDINDNWVPVWLGRKVEVHNVFQGNRDAYTITLDRTFEVGGDCLIQIANHGWKPGETYNGSGNLPVISFLFRDVTTRQYLNIHDEMTVKTNGTLISEHYTYDYQYYTDINWNRQARYVKGNCTINSDPDQVFYFPKETGYLANEYCTFPQPYVLDAGYYTCTRWILDPDFPNPAKTAAAVDAIGFHPGVTRDSYLGFEPIRDYIWADKYVIEEMDQEGEPTGRYIATIPTSGLLLPPWGDYEGWSGFSYQYVDEMDSDNIIDILYCDPTSTNWQWQNTRQKWFWGGDVVIGPGGYGLYNIYLPSRIDVEDLSAAMWGNNWESAFYKLFQNPMESVVSFHAIYAPLQYDSRDVIHFGNVVGNGTRSFPTSLKTSQAIQLISCGSVQVDEYFKNAMDYAPYTDWEIYLPYIGFRPLRADEITGGTVAVNYKIDITTGGLVAIVEITKNGGSIVMYTYSGNCAIQLPLSSADYSRRVTGVISAGLSLGTAALTGGATAPMALGAVGSAVMNAKTQIDRSGSLSGNVGSLGPNKPYLIATRPIPAMPTNFEQYYGFPASQLAVLSNCSGYTRVKEVHLDGIDCSEREKVEIERLLKTGVFL